ncbi:MAG: L-threonylcarbamoyladenylate synthase [Minisyncoccales bacterium]
METKILKIDSKKPQKSKINVAANIIKNSQLVAFPTETVYGLGANGLDKKAVKKIFIAKGRPQDNPLILHVCNQEQIKTLVKEIPIKAKKLMDKFWPGPLTIIFKKSKIVPKIITGNLNTVAIRMPKNKIALELIKESGYPLAAPSANLSGKPSPTSAKHVFDDLKGKIPLIMDGGKVEIGIESTVIDMTSKIPQILRPGKITKKRIEKIIGKIKKTAFLKTKKPKSPGMKYKHYSPKAKVIIINSLKEKKEIILKYPQKKIKFLKYESVIKMAKNMFNDFRLCDQKGYDIILVKEIKDKEFGFAIMDRLKKASGK